MIDRIVECVPNYSEGQRREVVESIVAAIRSVDAVSVVDVQSDADHNRSVVTFVGEPAAVEEAVFCSIARAAELIDMTQHQGAHPRMGATDVVPFVPLRGVTMGECVDMARRVGQRVGNELGIPVYLYEEAATRPERQNLADIRRGEYEVIRAEIEHVESRVPDFGPRQLGRAGATAIGARAPLIAFNVYLNTDDVAVARAVARVVRHSGGGLRYVKALGILADNRAQVTMNLTDFRKTSMLRVLDTIRSEAARYGAAVSRTEVVGLIPREALIDAAREALQCHDLKPDQILENHLAEL